MDCKFVSRLMVYFPLIYLSIYSSIGIEGIVISVFIQEIPPLACAELVEVSELQSVVWF